MNNQEVFLSDAIDVIEEILSSGGEFRLYPKGTSMMPLLRQGRDSVVLKRKDSGAEKHDIAFYRRKDGAFVLHRVMRVSKDGSYVMCGDNQTALEEGIERDQIIGYVDRVYRKDKSVDVSALHYRIYVFLWCIMPIRRLLGFGHRVYCGVRRRVIKLFKKK